MAWSGRPGTLLSVALVVLLGALFGSAIPAVAQPVRERTANLTVHYRQCEEAPADGDWYGACHDNPVVGAYIAAIAEDLEGKPVDAEGTTDEQGNVTLDLYAGAYSLIGAADAPPAANIFCSRPPREAQQIIYPVVIGTGGEVICDYYVVTGSQQPEAPATIGFEIGVINCETDPGNYSPYSGLPLPEGCEAAVGVGVTVALTDGTEVASCITDDRGGCTVDAPNEAEVVATVDELSLPAGYVPRENPIQTRAVTEFAGAFFINILQPDDGGADEPAAEPTEPPVVEPDPDARPAAIHAGTCDEPGDAVADLSGVSAPDGETTGAAGALPVESSFTRLDLPLDDILATDHVVAVFGDDDEDLVACGPVGGIVAEDGSLAVGLYEIDGSGLSGIAYLAPDGDQILVTAFLAEDLSGPVGTPAAS